MTEEKEKIEMNKQQILLDQILISGKGFTQEDIPTLEAKIRDYILELGLSKSKIDQVKFELHTSNEDPRIIRLVVRYGFNHDGVIVINPIPPKGGPHYPDIVNFDTESIKKVISGLI